MYYILIQYFFHPGTFNVPTDDYIRDEYRCGRRITFDSVAAAKDYLAGEGVTWEVTPQHYQFEGNYTLRHGEYSRPSYKIRKMRSNQEV